MNILLLAMSYFPGQKELGKDGHEFIRLKKSKYTYDDENPKEYYSQLEPITRMLIEKGHRPDEIIILCTRESVQDAYIKLEQNDQNEQEISPFDFYIQRINSFIKNDETITYTKIPRAEDKYIDPGIPESKNNAIAEVADYLMERKNAGNDLHIWIDTQGGMRDISLVTNAIVSLLKTSEVKIEGIYSINFLDRIGKIMNQNSTYHIFEFVSGMNEFIQYGRADQLVNYYDLIGSEVPELVKLMKQLADAIMLCDLTKFDDVLVEIRESLNKENQIQDALFKIFVEQIESDYGNILKEDVSVLDKIQWFHKKKLYQQTLTYIESKSLEEWGKNKLIWFEAEQELPDNEKIAWNNMLNRYIGYVCKIRENMSEDNASVFKDIKEKIDYDLYWKKENGRGGKRSLFPTNLSVNVQKCTYDFSVKTGKDIKLYDKNLFKMIAFYKLIKMERNLFNHMGTDKRMSIEVLDELIDEYVNISKQLYKYKDR